MDLVKQLEQMTSSGVIRHTEHCQCDHCTNTIAEAFLSVLAQEKEYNEAPTRPW